MVKSKKEKKQARKERQEMLREAAEHVKERLLADALAPKDEVEYVLEEDIQRQQQQQDMKRQQEERRAASDEAEDNEEDDGDRVALPAGPSGSATVSAAALRKAKRAGAGASAAGRKHHRLSWQALKLAVTDRYGAEAAELVSEHDGNADDAFFTVLMKMQPHTVPVPRHWDRLRPFMALQADREEAVGLIPAEIQALGVEKIRASKDKRAAPDQTAFMTCFMTGTPLQRKTFGVELSAFGDVFREGKWMPKARFEPGRLSQRLRQALGMGPHAPPPWLYSMQTMRRLPPAYPALRVPGLNAPIPAGAQWGRGQGQWGDPPRGETNNFLFPGVMDEAAASAANAPRLWGVVPPLRGETARATATTTAASPAPPPLPSAAAATPAASAASKVVITPTPFRPQAYQPQASTTARYVSSTPQEYVRVQDSGAGATVAVGHRMMRKDAVQPATAQRQAHPPYQPTAAPQGRHPPAVLPQGKAAQKLPPPPPNPRGNRGTKF